MRIEIRVSGGFAGIRRPPAVLDTAALEPAAAREAEALAASLAAAGGGAPPVRGADLMAYEVTIDGARTVTFREPGVPPAVRELLRLTR